MYLVLVRIIQNRDQEPLRNKSSGDCSLLGEVEGEGEGEEEEEEEDTVF